MRKRYFIKKAIKHPGFLRRKAKKAHMTVNAYARKHYHDPGHIGRSARLYENVLKPGAKKAARNRRKHHSRRFLL